MCQLDESASNAPPEVAPNESIPIPLRPAAREPVGEMVLALIISMLGRV